MPNYAWWQRHDPIESIVRDILVPVHGDYALSEVAVDPPDVATVTVRRAFGAYEVGRVINPSLATSQCIGGMIGGIGMALMERTVLDWRDGRPVNAHMADYLVPLNLDIQQIEAQMVEEDDPHVNPSWCERPRRNRARRDGSRHRQRCLSRDGHARARLANSNSSTSCRSSPNAECEFGGLTASRTKAIEARPNER